MASMTTNVPGFGLLSRAGVAIWDTLIAVGEASARAQEIDPLHALSDEELAKRGIDRSRIVEYAFRDRVAF